MVDKLEDPQKMIYNTSTKSIVYNWPKFFKFLSRNETTENPNITKLHKTQNKIYFIFLENQY